MKLLTCEYNGRTFAAVSDGKMVYEAAPDMYALIKALDGKLPGADMLRGEGTALDRVRLLAPIPEPHQDVVCLGMNYIDHSAEAERWGKEDFVKNAGKAVYFSKRAAYIVGPGGEIDPHFDIVDGLDYEAELAVVLGKTHTGYPKTRPSTTSSATACSTMSPRATSRRSTSSSTSARVWTPIPPWGPGSSRATSCPARRSWTSAAT